MKDKLLFKFKRFFTHPIWCYSLTRILNAVQRDWDGPVGTSARGILKIMAEKNTHVLIVTFSEKDIPFLELTCTASEPKVKEN